MIDPAVGVDKYQTVAFDCNRYSVPRPFAHRMVTVKGYVDCVVLVAEGRVVATHARSYQKQTLVLDPVHYLATLGRKPGALDHAPVFRDGRCRHASPTSAPARKTPRRDGRRTTVRAGIATPGRASPDAWRKAIDACISEHLTIALRPSSSERGRSPRSRRRLRTASPPQLEMPGAAQVQVPLPDLNCYDQFLDAEKTINHLQMR